MTIPDPVLERSFEPSYSTDEVSLESVWLEVQKLQRQLAAMQATLGTLLEEEQKD